MHLNKIYFIFQICAILIIAPCEEATKEAQKTSYISYKLLNDMPVCNKQQGMRDDLTLLAQQSYYHSPTFNAAGFYQINHTLLSCILASVTSYLIVLIQFN